MKILVAVKRRGDYTSRFALSDNSGVESANARCRMTPSAEIAGNKPVRLKEKACNRMTPLLAPCRPGQTAYRHWLLGSDRAILV